MNLIEHLEYIIGLVERSASQAEIKSALLGMREEVEGYEAAAAKKISLPAQATQVVQSPRHELSAEAAGILQFLFDAGESVSGHQMQQRFRLQVSVLDHHLDALLERKLIEQTRLGGTSASCWFCITGNGRDFIMHRRA